MKILAMDTSSLAASCAILEEERPVSQFYTDARLTHSQTIMPMVQAMLSAAMESLEAVDAFAVSVGPGSFTGLRIGVAAVKGMAQAVNKPCIPVSTLEGLAWNLRGQQGIACAVMDARCGQVYTALFDLEGGAVTRLTEDMAIPLEELAEMLKKQEKNIILVGDGAVLCYNSLVGQQWAAQRIVLAPQRLRLQQAASVGLAACSHRQQAVEAGELAPAYLRLPQAQRELLQKQQG